MLYTKGEEALHLYRQLNEYQNVVLDQSLFEETFTVTRVTEAEVKVPAKAQMLCFVRDYNKPGVYFMRIFENDKNPAAKLIPLLDLDNVECVDETFSLHLVTGANPNKYDEKKKSSIKRIFSFRSLPDFPMKFEAENAAQIADIYRKVK